MSKVDHNAYGVVTAPDTVRFERLLPGPVERVWAYLTEGDKRCQWLAGGEMEPKLGGRADLVFRHSDFTDEPPPEKYKHMESGFSAPCRITEFDPPRVLGISWPGDGTESEVVFELFPENGKVLLVVTHKRLANRGEMVNVSGGWHAHLGVLAAVLDGTEKPPFWGSIGKFKADYEQRYDKS